MTGLHLLPDDLVHLPSDPKDQEFLLRLLCHLAQINGSVSFNESAFIEHIAEKMGRIGWEFPQEQQRLKLGQIGRIHTCWQTADQKIWLTQLLRRLAVADGLLDADEERFLEEITGRLFSTSEQTPDRVPWNQLDERERQLLEAASEAASIGDTHLWHRKSEKVVGAVIGVDEGSGYRMFRGVNFELSQPTGSRCAEQVALGAAIAHYGGRLRYQDIREIAVVAGQSVPKPVSNPLPPCGVCCEMIRKINEAGDQIMVYMLRDGDPEHVIRVRFSDYYPPRL